MFQSNPLKIKDLPKYGKLEVQYTRIAARGEKSESFVYADMDDYNGEPLADLLADFAQRGYRPVLTHANGLRSGVSSIAGTPVSVYIHFRGNQNDGCRYYSVLANLQEAA